MSTQEHKRTAHREIILSLMYLKRRVQDSSDGGDVIVVLREKSVTQKKRG